ncbi:MAG: GNAT family N-acetyltransferase [Candidatus Dormibacteraeota bacterium]|nr:GNAT family N-acetyltransferase [Candidatus Dormibacteraeota bacterium]
MFSIVELSQLDDLRDLAELLREVWARSGEPPINSDILKALAHSGNYVCGAYLGHRLVGGLVGWFGGVPPRDLHLHSHILGVVSGSEAHGLGFELKQHQRRWCLERGVKVIEWTTDPLVRRNAYFNLTKLGARAGTYLVNVYGQMTDGINAGEESDRLLITWQLESQNAEAAAGGRAAEPSLDELVRHGAATVLSVGPSGEPVGTAAGHAHGEISKSDARVLLCEVPDDIVVLRQSDPTLARDWRMALRTAITDALAAGYEISGATRSGWYMLERRAN